MEPTMSRCVSIVSVPSGACRYPCYAVALYEARQRQDGVWTWRRVRVGERQSSKAPGGRSKVILAAAAECAAQNSCELVLGVRHGTPVRMS